MCNNEQNNKSESLGQCRLSWKEKKTTSEFKSRARKDYPFDDFSFLLQII